MEVGCLEVGMPQLRQPGYRIEDNQEDFIVRPTLNSDGFRYVIPPKEKK
jgi:hypothetical protein